MSEIPRDIWEAAKQLAPSPRIRPMMRLLSTSSPAQSSQSASVARMWPAGIWKTLLAAI